MNMQTFEEGACYIATPAMPGQPQRLVAIIERKGTSLLLALVEGLVSANAQQINDREFAQFDTDAGLYNISPVGMASANDYARIQKALRKSA